MANHSQRNLLHAYLDDELDLVRSMELEEHLAECTDCAQEAASFRGLKEVVQRTDLRFNPSADFHHSLLTKLRKQERKDPEPLVGRSRVPLWGWAAVAVCLLLAAAAFIFDVTRQRQHDLATEIVSEHVRSLMANHLTDVLTSDQHTVKPWFTGKLDFSPQVRDLSAEGFELIGGRLEYLDKRNAAAIIYQRHKHVINLFTWPSTSSSSNGQIEVKQNGYNIMNWTQNGMTYWAVSDLQRSELDQFAQLYK